MNRSFLHQLARILLALSQTRSIDLLDLTNPMTMRHTLFMVLLLSSAFVGFTGYCYAWVD